MQLRLLFLFRTLRTGNGPGKNIGFPVDQFTHFSYYFILRIHCGTGREITAGNPAKGVVMFTKSDSHLMGIIASFLDMLGELVYELFYVSDDACFRVNIGPQ